MLGGGAQEETKFLSTGDSYLHQPRGNGWIFRPQHTLHSLLSSYRMSACIVMSVVHNYKCFYEMKGEVGMSWHENETGGR